MRILQALAVVFVDRSRGVSRRRRHRRVLRRRKRLERRRRRLAAARVHRRSGPNGTRDPFPNPIPAEEGAIKVNFVEFATLPDVGANTARPC